MKLQKILVKMEWLKQEKNKLNEQVNIVLLVFLLKKLDKRAFQML